MVEKQPNKKIIRYHLKCLNCDYIWETKYAKIPANCPSCKSKIHNSSNYQIVQYVVQQEMTGILGFLNKLANGLTHLWVLALSGVLVLFGVFIVIIIFFIFYLLLKALFNF